MKKPLTLRSHITLFVLAILVISSVLVVICFNILLFFNVIPSAFAATFWMPIILVLVSSLIGGVLSVLTTRKIIKPIDHLTQATKSVADGDFTVRVDDEECVSELKPLLENFNSMTSELEGVEIFRSDFINNFSHEFKTPIVSIRGFAKQLCRDDITEEQKKQYAEIIASESERLSTMSANVLLLTKLENQQLVTDRAEYQLDEQLRYCIIIYEKEWERKNIDLSVDLPEVKYKGNAEILSHVWINILGNAVKFTPENGKISVTLVEKADEVSVRISDTGIGMSRQVLDRIFDKFYQGDDSHTGTGNGLGLSLVRRIIELCDGRIVVESDVGKGSTFTVYLPKQ